MIRGVYALIYKGKVTFGTNEDTGPADQSTNREFSPSQVSDAGMKVEKNGTGGTDDNSVQIIYFKGCEGRLLSVAPAKMKTSSSYPSSGNRRVW